MKEPDATETNPMPNANAYAAALEPGLVLQERFRIEKFIANGGMGEVYLATDLELGGRVALKTIRHAARQNEANLARFRREIQLARQVSHPNICRVYDFGRDMVRGEETLFLTMEYLDGETLWGWLKRRGTMTPDELWPVARQMAEGLDELHRKDIVHRDLKPSNIMLTGEPARAVITDFGLARMDVSSEAGGMDTQTAAIVGTPAYMAPEQLKGEPGTKASDVYAFGLVLRSCLLGPKSEGKLSEPWKSIVARCLEADAAARPGSAGEALERSGLARRWLAIAAAVAAVLLAWWGWNARPVDSVGVAAVVEQTQALLRHYYLPGNLSGALEQLEKLVRENPKSAVAQAELGAAQWIAYALRPEAETLRRAVEASNAAIALDAELARPHQTLGAIHISKGQSELAATELRRALAIDPRDPATHHLLGRLHELQGRTAEVEPALQRAVDLAPEDWRYRRTLGNYWKNNGQAEKAVAELKEAARLAPRSRIPFNELGGAYLALENYGAAREAYEKSLAIEPNYLTYTNLAALQEQEGKYEEAVATLQQALKMRPESALAWGNLGSAYQWAKPGDARAREAFAKAVELAEEDRKRNPNDADLLATMASYYGFLGQREKALPLLRKAMVLGPDAPAVAYRIGEAYEILGQRAEAIDWITKAVRGGYSRKYVERSPELAKLRADEKFQRRLVEKPRVKP